MVVFRYQYQGSKLIHEARRAVGRDAERFADWLYEQGAKVLSIRPQGGAA